MVCVIGAVVCSCNGSVASADGDVNPLLRCNGLIKS